MAQSTREIKRRIKGIGSTRQITKAMELVSSTKVRKRRIKLEKTRPYYNTVLKSIKEVLKNVNINHPLLQEREVKKSLYITINADRGLAGGYNSNINRLIDNKFKNNKDSISLITVGTKSRDFFKGRNYNILESFVGISEEPEFSDAREIGKLAMDLYIKGEIDEINVVFTEFVSTISYKPQIIKLLPSEKIKKEEGKPSAIVDFEPSPEEVLEYLIPKYVESSIYGALIEASTSEQSARRSAMSAATDNANEIIDELNMVYNRARQSAITMELSEIVAGAEALK
ncbi:ATP synthase F1 subunit gamma [Tissierella creatinophila]|uniref:ATP synthase gamma chain n=1 Tax=Tissierella creatinophila DSM 6911 TaxID=1123403 RepID=A0A1U7M3Q6_TISCR|nr:ATP synthase F1 subunit gamma [Tissierella creatinophila]OLS01828.1 ATP synthase gamma chain, sodium ion specific [Tissierella creatinophila DSM 6911]